MNRLPICAALALAVPALAWNTASPNFPVAPTTLKVLGAGARLSWKQAPLEAPQTWLDAHAVIRPLPLLLGMGGWGRSDVKITGGASDTTIRDTRWDLGVGVVILNQAATGYIPLSWRRVTQSRTGLGRDSWNEWSSGLGAMVPINGSFWLRTEGQWVISGSHANIARGTGSRIRQNGLELQLGFLYFAF